MFKNASFKMISKKPLNWYFGLHVTKDAKTPIVGTATNKVDYLFEGHPYHLEVLNGIVSKKSNSNVFTIQPKANFIRLNMADVTLP